MRWNFKNRTTWHRWFAWHPVQVERQIAWMCWVERRGVPAYDFWEPFLQWEYRELTRTTEAGNG